jgi:hypothetical protein
MRCNSALSFSLIALLLTGCVSRYYWGANLQSDGRALVRPVPRRLDRELHNFSQTCVEYLLRRDLEGIKHSAASDLRQQVEQNDMLGQLQEIQSKYALSGKCEQIKSRGGGWWLDETISKDPYRIYDFFITEYKLHGKTDAHAFLVIKKVSSGFSLLGFDIHSADHKAEKSDIAYMPSGLKGWNSFR